MSTSRVSLKIVIVGAGLAGLAATIACARSGHSVTVIEAVKHLSEVGAGIQITPNASRILYKWGLQHDIERVGCEPQVIAVHRYSDGKILAREKDFGALVRKKYGSPLIEIHRGDLHSFLHRCALETGVEVKTGTRVSHIDFERGLVHGETGATFNGDLIVGADGLWSKCREALLGHADAPLPTGDLAYRIMLDAEKIEDPELRSWVENPQCHFWIGPQTHAVAYSIRGGSLYNIVLLCPDNLPTSVAKQEGSVEEMRALFEGWDPILSSFLTYVEKVDKWKLMHRPALDSWKNERGNFTLIGDACHPMLPYLAQGANSAIEDGAALSTLLQGMSDKSELPRRMQLWEDIRKKRGEGLARETFRQRDDYHLPDGPEQEARDAVFMSQLGGPVAVKFPSRWSCPEIQPWLFGYDAIGEAASALESGIEATRQCVT